MTVTVLFVLVVEKQFTGLILKVEIEMTLEQAEPFIIVQDER